MPRLSTTACIIESVSPRDLAESRAESPLTAQLMKLLEIPHLDRQVETISDLERTSVLCNRLHAESSIPPLFVISAHGCADGIQLTDGTIVEWKQFFDCLGESARDATFIFSSCSVLRDDVLEQHILTRDIQPRSVIGFRDDVRWKDAATALCMIIGVHHRLERDIDPTSFELVRSHTNLYSAIWQLLGVDVQALEFANGRAGSVTGSRIVFSNSADILEKGISFDDAMQAWTIGLSLVEPDRAKAKQFIMQVNRFKNENSPGEKELQTFIDRLFEANYNQSLDQILDGAF